MNRDAMMTLIDELARERDELDAQIATLMALGLGDPGRKDLGALRRRYGRTHDRIERLYGRLHAGTPTASGPDAALELAGERDRLLSRIRELSLLYPSDPRTCELAALRGRWSRVDRRVRDLHGPTAEV